MQLSESELAGERRASRMPEADRRRREFIRAHHPDRGGDPAAFVSGLRSFDAERGPDQLPPVVVVRRRAWLLRLVSALATRLHSESKPPRVR
jgi:hypothetical protein